MSDEAREPADLRILLAQLLTTASVALYATSRLGLGVDGLSRICAAGVLEGPADETPEQMGKRITSVVLEEVRRGKEPGEKKAPGPEAPTAAGPYSLREIILERVRHGLQLNVYAMAKRTQIQAEQIKSTADALCKENLLMNIRPGTYVRRGDENDEEMARQTHVRSEVFAVVDRGDKRRENVSSYTAVSSSITIACVDQMLAEGLLVQGDGGVLSLPPLRRLIVLSLQDRAMPVRPISKALRVFSERTVKLELSRLMDACLVGELPARHYYALKEPWAGVWRRNTGEELALKILEALGEGVYHTMETLAVGLGAPFDRLMGEVDVLVAKGRVVARKKPNQRNAGRHLHLLSLAPSV
jgi:hypothetical protein